MTSFVNTAIATIELLAIAAFVAGVICLGLALS